MIVFKKQPVVIRKTLQKEKIRDDFVIICQNSEEAGNLKNPERDTMFIIKENKNALSVKGIIEYAKIDAPHEIFIEIREACWNMVENGVLKVHDLRESDNEKIRNAFFYIA